MMHVPEFAAADAVILFKSTHSLGSYDEQRPRSLCICIRVDLFVDVLFEHWDAISLYGLEKTLCRYRPSPCLSCHQLIMYADSAF